MRIHTDTLTVQDIREAASRACVLVHRMDLKGSRSRDRAYDVILAGRGRTGTRYGNSRDRYVAATWDEWGIFLAELFRRDDRLTIPRVYEDGDHFRWVTYGRYDDLTPDRQHVRHRWVPIGRAVTGAYLTFDCRDGECGASVRRLAYGVEWADLSALAR